MHACCWCLWCPCYIVACVLHDALISGCVALMKRAATTPCAPSSAEEAPSPLSKMHRKSIGGTSLQDASVGHYLAGWALSCLLAWRQFNIAVKDLDVGTFSPHTGEAMKWALEAYIASTPPPPPALCASLCSTCATPSLHGGPSKTSTCCASWSTTPLSRVVRTPLHVAAATVAAGGPPSTQMPPWEPQQKPQVDATWNRLTTHRLIPSPTTHTPPRHLPPG